ncbi:hypothetical protein RHSIM_Rhsim01G0124000 [Rhododendron simsii]|uniref:DNA-directed RNA polymerase n=1 Tax=Rhododendron simsii TaxID=118357 RepID=A0A834HGV9_RHOSS|nr:hypothetical protein RHSIM_Rhsim01G0124000 [Rhododendron simsii]
MPVSLQIHSLDCHLNLENVNHVVLENLENVKFQIKNIGIFERALSTCCEEACQVSINEAKTNDGACYLELKLPSRSNFRDGSWNFLERYGYRYGDEPCRPLLPAEVMVMLKKLPDETRKKLAGKGYFPQDGYIIQCLPVPPNCLSVPDVSDGITVMSSDLSISVLKKVLKQVEIIKSSRSGTPNFESHEVEAHDLQAAVAQYLDVRGTSKASRDVDTRFGISKEPNNSSTKAWLEKMKTLFIRKGSGFSSRSVITGDAYKGVHEIGLPFEIAQRITFEERVTQHNMQYLQRLVDEKLCLTYTDGLSTYSLREGSKGHTFLRPGQVVHRRIMDGDIVFINRPPTTHKHSLQALSVYVHEDHTVKINPLICGPLSADFDGDCVHLFYPQSLAAKAEVLELFSVEKQLLSSHNGNLNLQLAADALLSLKIMLKNYFLTRPAAQQLAMFVSNSLPHPALFKAKRSGPQWTARAVLEDIHDRLQEIAPLLGSLHSTYNELIELQVEKHLRLLKLPVANFILRSSAIGYIIDSKSDSSITKVVQQIGFLGLQLSPRGKFYTKALVEDMASLFHNKYPIHTNYPSEEFGLVRSCLFRGLDPYQEMAHSISAREVIVRSSRGLTEPGTLFKNLMAILRDVVICYDGTVRNVCSNSIIQFEYGTKSMFAAGEPVGVLAATSMSNPAYKAVLDSSPSSNSSWEMMKEILLCSANFKNSLSDRRVLLYLNDCECGRKYCRENAAYLVKNQLKKVSLKDIAGEFLIEYNAQQTLHASSEFDPNLLCHVHLKKELFLDLNISMQEICEKCEGTVDSLRKKKKVGHLFKRISLSASEDCSFGQQCHIGMPCLKLFWQGTSDHLEMTSHILADTICPALLETIIKGDPRVCTASIIWISPDTTAWIRNPCKTEKGELALDVVLEKEAVKQSGDAWRIVLDSCLPVIHLIDTSRSIPHAIKQVQELLGISCAFEQAVQRLSTSVSMVAKGVLKEHLILLANSMTCAGSMVGFNSGGIKALSRSLNVQVPFTEATLFTPKKCFERAAEKCHLDSLSSIVASCSWGKQVSVGTGSRFDVLWDTREVGMNELDGIDVYNFLNMVRSSSKQEETTSACLGAEIDYLELENDIAEWAMSPERSSDKPIFEDSYEFQDDLENQMVDVGRPGDSSWEKVSSVNTEPSKEWAVDKGNNWDSGPSGSKPNGWSSWGADAVQTEDILCSGQQDLEQVAQPKTSVAWGSLDTEEKKDEVQSQTGYQHESPSNIWGSSQKSKSTEAKGWAVDKKRSSGDPTTVTKSNGWSTWGVSGSSNEESPSNIEPKSQMVRREDSPANSWKSSQNNDGSGGQDWGTNNEQWGAGKTVSKPSGNSWKSSQNDDSSGGKDWGTDNEQWGAGKTVSKPSGNSWMSSQNNDSSGGKDWGTDNEQWGAGKTVSKPSGLSSWVANKVQRDDLPSTAAQETEQVAQREDSSDGTDWLAAKKQNSGACTVSKQSGWSSWGADASQAEENVSAVKPKAWSSWGADAAHVERNEESNQSASKDGWDSPNIGGNEGAQVQWGHGKRSFGKREFPNSHGRDTSNAGEWRNKPIVNLTATRQRLDMFTSEEQDILVEIEQTMQSIRRIMHQTGYKDGDPLPADDQSFVVDSVFTHHPDKAAKAGAGIDHVMGTGRKANFFSFPVAELLDFHFSHSSLIVLVVLGCRVCTFRVSKHSSFQESRCFYIVSVDGRKEDFSYLKCLENFIKGKYPDRAEAFIGKYFKKHRSQNRERSSGPVVESSGGPNSGQNASPEEEGSGDKQ